MHLRRLFQVLVLGGGALVAVGCGGDSAVRPTGDQQQLLPDGGVMNPSPSPMPGGGMGGGSTGGGGGTMGGPPGW